MPGKEMSENVSRAGQSPTLNAANSIERNSVSCKYCYLIRD